MNQSEIKSIRVLITNRCNLRCTYCHNEFQPTPASMKSAKEPLIDLQEIEEIINGQLCCSDLESIKISGGEPTLSPETTIKILTLGLDLKFRNRVLLSNMVAVNEAMLANFAKAGLTHIRVMLPSFEPTEYALETRAKPSKLFDVLEHCALARSLGITVRANMVLKHDANLDTEKVASVIAKRSDFSNAIDELGFLIDARSKDPSGMFKKMKGILENLGDVEAISHRKVNATVLNTPVYLRKCEDWELFTHNLETDEIRIVAPGVFPLSYEKGRAYVD